jgi:AbiV family abortive infection protein
MLILKKYSCIKTKIRLFFNRLVRGNRAAKSKYFLNSTELDSGIQLCVEKARRLANASKLLANNEEFLPHSLGLYLFALEEYGKSILLQQAKSSCGNLHLVPRKIFGFDRKAHKKKINEGMKNLPTKTITLEAPYELKQNPNDKTSTVRLKDDEITVSIVANMSGNFSSTGNLDILEDIRWRSFYVDWDNVQRYWKSELRPQKSELLKLISELENCIN